MNAGERFSIAQVSPYAWESGHEVNEFVRRLSEELTARGHRVLVAAPSDSRAAIRESRAAIRRARAAPDSLFEDSAPRVLALGQSLPFRSSGREGRVSVPLDVNRTLEQLLTAVPLDFVHVHEPFAPSASSAALRHSRSLNVGSFHAPAERILSTQIARRFVEVFFGRLDARTAGYAATGDLLERHFAGEYRLLRPGAEPSPPAPGEAPGRGPEILFCAVEERAALRLFLRALRRVPLDLPWRATVWSATPAEAVARLNRRLRERVRLVGPAEGPRDAFIARADVLCLASAGQRPAPGLIAKAIVSGTVPVASGLAVYQELEAEGERGLTFQPGDFHTLAGQLARLVSEPELRGQLLAAADGLRADLRWSRVARQVEEVYRSVAARRHDPADRPDIGRRLQSRRLIECDLHMHTDHSFDCATPVDVLLETACDRGLGAIAITDHNEISGALEAAEMADRIGIKVIVAEEIKTASEGEVIGLFLSRKVDRGMSMAETLAEIRRQGGLVYVPHPFDRLHSVPDYEHLLKVVEDIDIIEVFNPRVAFSAFNEEAERFAAKYRIVAGAGSDSHVAQGLGSVRIRLKDFDGPEEFLESMRAADIVRKHKNLVYVQALKFLQTTGRPAPARRARAAKPARAVRGGRGRAPRA